MMKVYSCKYLNARMVKRQRAYRLASISKMVFFSAAVTAAIALAIM